MAEPIPGGIGPLPDAEALIAGYLAAAFAASSASVGSIPLTAVAVGDRIPPDYDGSQGVVTVDRLGGPPGPIPQWSDVCHLDVKAIGPYKATAYALIAQVRPLLAVARYAEFSGAVVQSVDETVGPQWFPDATGDYPESGFYLLQVEVTLHP